MITEPICDINNNEIKSNTLPQTEVTKSDSNENQDGNENENCEVENTGKKTKQKQFTNPLPFDLRLELKQKIDNSQKLGFLLKKSSTNVDIFNKDLNSKRILKKPEETPRDLLKSFNKKIDSSDADSSDALENLSFKEKLKLIEQSSKNSNRSPV